MSIDTWLGISGIAIGVIGIILAYVFYRRSLRTKVLGVAYTEAIPVLLTVDDIQVSYDGTPVSAISRVYVLFWNRGTAPIERSDFLSPIEFKYNAPLLKIEISDKDAAVRASLNPQASTLEIELLRPGEAILVHSEVADETPVPDITIEMKSADMSTFIGVYRSLYAGIAATLLTLCLLAVQTIMLYRLFPPQPSWESRVPDNFFIFIGSLLLAAAIYILPAFLIGTLFQKILQKLLERSTNRVAWHFSHLKLSAFGMGARTRAFRKAMAQLKLK